MKILFDHCTPAPLRKFLSAHEVSRTGQMGWADAQNGELLKLAEDAGFDLFISCDQSLAYQQNLKGRKIAVLVLGIQHWPDLEPFGPTVAVTADQMSVGEYRWLF